MHERSGEFQHNPVQTSELAVNMELNSHLSMQDLFEMAQDLAISYRALGSNQ